jgi:hypothetical protein
MTFFELTTDIISDLQHGGFIIEAEELQYLADLALDETLVADMRNDALKKIQIRCHVKWLGDLFLHNLSQNEWWGKIEKLGKSATKKMQSFG